jgi:dihydrofolate synthase/folylpolyglutamate synthase
MPWERAARPVDLVKVLGGKAEATDGMATALQRVADLPGPVLVCGSLYLLAAFYELYPEFLSRNSR